MFFFLDDERQISDVSWDVMAINPNYEVTSVSNEMYQRIVQLSDERMVYRDPNQFLTDVFAALNKGQIIILSFDHDIAWQENGEEVTGYTVMKRLTDELLDLLDHHDPKYNHVITKQLFVYVHSKNPIGANNILTYWASFLKSVQKTQLLSAVI